MIDAILSRETFFNASLTGSLFLNTQQKICGRTLKAWCEVSDRQSVHRQLTTPKTHSHRTYSESRIICPHYCGTTFIWGQMIGFQSRPNYAFAWKKGSKTLNSYLRCGKGVLARTRQSFHSTSLVRTSQQTNGAQPHGWGQNMSPTALYSGKGG